MSYRKPNTGNTMNNYFTRLRDFNRISPKILKAENVQSFEIWLDKLIQIDKRSLVIFLKEHKEEIPTKHWERAAARLSRWLDGGGT